MSNRLGKLLWNTAVFTAGALVTTTIVDRAMAKKEKENFRPYGFKVQTQFGGMNISINGERGPVIVLLSGYGTAAPILDFSPLAKACSCFAKVITIEYLGYGCSDKTHRTRTLQHITEEIHEVLQRLHIKEYYLAPHSISGVYALYYLHRYPEEVKGVIAMDTSVPGQIDYSDSTMETKVMSTMKKLGLVRLLDLLAPGSVSACSHAYDEETMKLMKEMSLSNEPNLTIEDEGNRILQNFNACRSFQYPKDMPVLMFLSSQTSEMTKGWWEHLHEKQIEHLECAKLIKLQGKHYLHWNNSKLMAEEIKRFVIKED